MFLMTVHRHVLITGIPFNDSKEFKTWNFVDI